MIFPNLRRPLILFVAVTILLTDTADGAPFNASERAALEAEAAAGNILSINVLAGLNLTDGDLVREKGADGERALFTNCKRWPTTEGGMVINYAFGATGDDGDDEGWRGNIRQALRYIENESCIRFKESTAEGPHIHFRREDGCYASPGYTGSARYVSIGKGCDRIDTIVHEVMHALCFMHEHSRPDRDEHINVDQEAVDASGLGSANFQREPDANLYGTGYELGSKMHYDPVIMGRTWFVPKDRRYLHNQRDRRALAYKDLYLINHVYCKDICTSADHLRCGRYGYVDSKNCSSCKCIKGHGGATCQFPGEKLEGKEVVVPWNSSIIVVLEQGKTLNSSLYPKHRENGLGGMESFVRIEATDPALRISLNVTSGFDCELPSNAQCKSFVEVKHLRDKTINGAKVCCGSTLFITDDSIAELRFVVVNASRYKQVPFHLYAALEAWAD